MGVDTTSARSHVMLTSLFLASFTGYKLAFNYLKSKRLTDAIDIAQFVRAILMRSISHSTKSI